MLNKSWHNLFEEPGALVGTKVDRIGWESADTIMVCIKRVLCEVNNSHRVSSWACCWILGQNLFWICEIGEPWTPNAPFWDLWTFKGLFHILGRRIVHHFMKRLRVLIQMGFSKAYGKCLEFHWLRRLNIVLNSWLMKEERPPLRVRHSIQYLWRVHMMHGQCSF